MEFAEVTVKESPGLCRCCLSEGCYKDLGTEYSWMNDTEVYADMLLDCFDIGITQHNDGPNGPKRLICEVCITRLRDACNFKKQVVDSEKKFIDMLGRGDFRSMEKQTVLLPIYSSAVPMKAEAIEEVTVAEDYDDSNVEFLDDNDCTEDEDLVKHERKAHPTPSTSVSKRGRPKKNEEPPEKKPKLKAKTKIAKDRKPERIIQLSNNECRRRNLQTLVNNTSVIPFKWRSKYICYFCGVDKERYIDLKEHTKTHIPCSTTERAMKRVKCETETKLDISEISCNVCLKHFSIIGDLISHLQEHGLWYHEGVSMTLATYQLVDLKCLVCDEIFNNFCNLIRHMNNRHPDNCFQCDICKQKFNKKRDLAQHIRAFHKKEYNCPKCPLSYKCFHDLLKHKSKEHQSRCNVCFQTFSCNQQRLSHTKTEHELENGGECGFCHKHFHSKISFFNHATKCDAFPPSDDVPVVGEEKYPYVKQLRASIACVINMTNAMPFKFYHNKFRCFYCVKEFISCDDLRQHTTVLHPICETSFRAMRLRGRSAGVKIKVDTSSLSCKMCFEKFNNLITAIEHIQIEHKAAVENHIDILQPFKLAHDQFACSFCDNVYRYFGLLLQHVNATHSDNSYICTYCGKTFPSYANLNGHLSRYHASGTHRCSVCNLVLPSKGSVKLHMGNKHGSKIVDCKQCPEKFVSRYRMMKHVVSIHNGGHKCPYCGLVFIKYSSMMNHVRKLHYKEKNVHCTLCSERFFDNNRLKVHMVRHLGERSFECDVCGKKFLWKKNLRGHIPVHNKNRNLF